MASHSVCSKHQVLIMRTARMTVWTSKSHLAGCYATVNVLYNDALLTDNLGITT